ncbi:MAG: hypothetical protein ABWZ82_01365 [Candidatus Limnocylindrales bacterium]
MTDPTSPIVNPFTLALLALVGLVLFGVSSFQVVGSPVPVP